MPLSMWLTAIIVATLYYLLRSFFVAQSDLRDAVALLRGLDRGNAWFWHGQQPLGLVPLYLVTRPFALFMPERVDAMRLAGALMMGVLGMLLYRWFERAGLDRSLINALLFLFYCANIGLVAGTMMARYAFNALFLFTSLHWGVRLLTSKELTAQNLLRYGLWGGLVAAIHQFLLLPHLLFGILLAKRGSSVPTGSYWGSLLGLTVVLYALVYLIMSPSTLWDAEGRKPGFGEWLTIGHPAPGIEPSRFSTTYFTVTTEQVLNTLIPLSKNVFEPIQKIAGGKSTASPIRDGWQYAVSGRFSIFLKLLFLIMGAITAAIMIGVWRGGERQRVPADWRVRWQLCAGCLLLMGIATLLWNGTTLGLYFWLWLLLIATVGLWANQFGPEEQGRLVAVLVALTVLVGLYSLQKALFLREETEDTERDLLLNMQPALRAEDRYVACLRLADWVRYYAAPDRVVSIETTTAPENTLRQLVNEAVSRGSGRVVVWDSALEKEVYQAAHLSMSAEWERSLDAAKAFWEASKPSLWRPDYTLLIYPTSRFWRGAVKFKGEE